MQNIKEAACRYRKCIIAALILLTSATTLSGKELPNVFIPKGDERQPLDVQMEYLDDPFGLYSLKEVESGRAGLFKSFDVSIHSYEYTKKVLWIRFSVDLRKYNEPYWFLTQNYEHVGNIKLFYPAQNGRDVLEIEEADSIDKRLFKIRNYLFKVPTPQFFPTTYYVRVEPRGHWLSVDFSWASTKGILEYIDHTQLFFGLFFGGLLVMWFYNFVLYRYLRDRAYLYYIYYLGCFIATFFYMNGFVPLALNWNPFYKNYLLPAPMPACTGQYYLHVNFLRYKTQLTGWIYI